MKNKSKDNLKKLVICALFAALGFSVTYFIPPVPLPFGYANLGDCIVLITAFLPIGLWSFAAAGLGPALADIFLGYGIYAPATFIIKALMAFVAFIIFKNVKKTNNKFVSFALTLLGCIAAELLMVTGYFLFELCLYGAGALASVTGNLLQGAVNTVVATVVLTVIRNSKALMKHF